MKKKKKRKSSLYFPRDIKLLSLLVLFLAIPVIFICGNQILSSTQQVYGESTHTILANPPHILTVSGVPVPSVITCGVNTANNTCPPGYVCISKGGQENGFCVPRPSFPQITGLPSSSPPITPPPGCFYKTLCRLKTPCFQNNCPPCTRIFVCPSGIPKPHPSCGPTPICDPKLGRLCKWVPPCGETITPIASISPVIKCFARPSCLDANPACALPVPPSGWCPAGTQSKSKLDTSNAMIYLNTWLRGLFGLH